jgi:antitoxin component YwqK of YwqJK toxin-antitoxin module
MRISGLIIILNITYCFILSSNSYSQIGRTETKNGKVSNYYSETDNLHSQGKQDDNGKQGRWSFYTDAPKAQASVFQFFTYKNDTLNGPFLKLANERRISGVYINGHYHGMIVIEDVVITGTDTVFLPVEEGSYENGMKSSFFKEYKKGILESEGGFDHDKRNGSWKFYDNSGDKPILQKKTYFKRDAKDGKEITYFEYDKDGNKVDKRSEFFYKDDIKNGPFEIKLKGKTIEKGSYSEGKLSGAHQIFIKEKDLNRFGNYFEGNLTGPVSFKDNNDAVKISGSYDNGKKSATWKYFDKNGKLSREENYKDDNPFGTWKYYENEKLFREVKYESGDAKEIIEYKPGNEDPIAEFYLNDVTGTFQEVEALLYYPDSSKLLNFVISVDLLKKPEELYNSYRKNNSNPELIKKNGQYEFTLKGTKIIEGYYEMDQMDGKWNYFYNGSVIWEKSFSDNKLTGEKFFNKSDKSLFKGTYEVIWPNGSPRFEFKIKDGLRNGKQIYFHKNGEEEKVEKFKEGIKG